MDTRITPVFADTQYTAPNLIDIGPVTAVTLGKYAEDSQDEDRYFE